MEGLPWTCSGTSLPHFSPRSLHRKGENTRSLLNDKRVVQEQRERYSQYSVVVDEVTIQTGGAEGQLSRDDYEDEYDDTYDGNQVGANDADSDDELITRR